MKSRYVARPPSSEPVCWIVIRRRGGWNAEPQIAGMYDSEGAALMASCKPEEFGRFEPTADDADVFTCHCVGPSLIVHVPVPMPE